MPDFPASPRTVDVRALLDKTPFGAYRSRLLVACLAIAVADGFDVQALAFVAPVLTDSWDISRATMGRLLTAGLFGMLIGSLMLGRLGDRIGRRPTLMASVLIFGLGSLATALCQSVVQIGVARIVTGIGLGGAIVAALALISEFSPVRHRATVVTAMFAGFPLGGTIGGLTAAPLMGNFGWQSVFVVGGLVPLVLIGLLWRRIPESLQFSVTKGLSGTALAPLLQGIDPAFRYQADDRLILPEQRDVRARVAELFVGHRIGGTLLLWTICFANLLVLYLLINWLPSILHESGQSLARANAGAALFNLGGVAGGLVLSRAVDRLGATRVLGVSFVATALCVWAISQVHDPVLMAALVFAAGTGIIGGQCGINAVIVGFYPTAIRSTGAGWALGFGRLGAMAGPIIGGLALGAGATLASVFSGLALPLIVCAISVAALSFTYRRSAAHVP